MSRDSAAVTKRVARALNNLFHVEVAGNPVEYRVHSGSGSTYIVTLPDGTCTCPDGERGSWCKHALRALFVTGHTPPVEGVPTDATTDNEGSDRSEPADALTGDSDSDERLAERVERFARTNPEASAIEALSQLGIDPTNRERVEELLAQ